MQPWMVARRFREFYALDAALRRNFPDVAHCLSSLPPKTMFGSLGSDTVQTRQRLLDAYIKTLVMDSRLAAVLQSSSVNEFLNISHRVGQIRAAALTANVAPTQNDLPAPDPFLDELRRSAPLSAEHAQRAFEEHQGALQPLTADELSKVEATVARLRNELHVKNRVSPDAEERVGLLGVAWPRVKATGQVDAAADLTLVPRALQCDEDLAQLAATIKSLIVVSKMAS